MLKFIMLVLAALTLSLSGCGTHYVITSQLIMTQHHEPSDIVETETYKAEASKIKTVALKAPSRCSNRTSDERTGKAETRERMMGTDCAVDMAEIERALTKASYKVISWTILEREMASNAEQKLSPLMAAKKLGAEILFQINSLDQSERTIGKIGADVEWKFVYYDADGDGKKLGEKEFDESDREYLKRKFFKRDELLKQIKVPSVTLDANASLVKNAESIWFYRWTHSDFSQAYANDQLIFCKPPMVCSLDSPSNSSGANLSNASNGKSSRDNESYSTFEQPEDVMKDLRFKLVQDVANNMISSFAKR